MERYAGATAVLRITGRRALCVNPFPTGVIPEEATITPRTGSIAMQPQSVPLFSGDIERSGG